MRLDPHQAIYHQWLAVHLCDAGRYREAFSEIDIAQADDLYWPSLNSTETYIALNARDYKDAGSRSEANGAAARFHNAIRCNGECALVLWPLRGRYGEWRRMAMLENDRERVKMEDEGL